MFGDLEFAGVTFLQYLSCFVCVILFVGFANRRKRCLHISMMVTALVIDLGMVLYLELGRGVVESIPGRTMSALLIFHICLSVVVLALYGVQVVSGVRKTKGRGSSVHRKVAYWFLAARVGNLLTSVAVSHVG